MNYVLVTGGTLSGIGKGVCASSVGLILTKLGFKVTCVKIDPYLNVDAGTMSPFEHGEVYVLDDGGEVDLDLGNYERFVGVRLTRDHNLTTGKVYKRVIEKERRGDYLGKTVQVVPHVVDEIQDWIEQVACIPVSSYDHCGCSSSKVIPNVCVIELGGTVGDIESAPFIEALRQLQFRKGTRKLINLHVSLVPVVGSVGEQKTKPVQNSVKALRTLGLYPDLILCRSSEPLQVEPQQKISQFCNVRVDCVLSCPDVTNLYKVPLCLLGQGVNRLLLEKLDHHYVPPHCNAGDAWQDWKSLADVVDRMNETKDHMNTLGDHMNILGDNTQLKIAIVGKYTGLKDSYLSLVKALQHASYALKVPLQIIWIEATDLPEDACSPLEACSLLESAHGILVPGGFGSRGADGKLAAMRHARVSKVPYFGICLGMQLAVVEYARNVLQVSDANSEEFMEHCDEPLIINMPEISKEHLGGTMRLGGRRTEFVLPYRRESLVQRLYREHSHPNVQAELDDRGNVESIRERHRHRYEVNPQYVDRLEEHGMRFVGKDEQHQRMEILELPDHPFFVGVQYHPEFLSRPQQPSPMFIGFLQAAQKRKTFVGE